MTSNAAQIDYWNGPGGERFARHQDAIDRGMAAITEAAMAFAAPKTDERVLDIGCGAGTTTLRLREAVGPNGSAAGVDVSEPLLNLARARAAAANADVAFVRDDAAARDFQPVFDLAFSRFGVMFFADPAAAFANIAKGLASGGRLVFVCWRTFAENLWASAPFMAALPLLPPQEPSDCDAPGPFAFGDGERLARLLKQAGFARTRIEKLDTAMGMGATLEEAAAQALQLGPLARAAAGLDDAAREPLRQAAAEALRPHLTAEGVRPPAACWLVRAGL